jgi:single-stranded DNA-binding protein
MFIGQIIGYVGADAKETKNGCSFPVSTKQRTGGEEKTLWVRCFLNYSSKVSEHLKKGTQVYITGDITADVFTREGTVEPSIVMNVQRIQLLSSKEG